MGLDAKGWGFSGRMPMMLHSGRPILYASRTSFVFNIDNMYYTAGRIPERLTPWKHYIPVQNDASDLEERLRWVLSPANAAKAKAIGENAQRFAAKYLTTEY